MAGKMKEKKRKKLTLLGWCVGITILIISIISFIFVWSPLTSLFTKRGIVPFLSGIISFCVIYFIFTVITITVIKFGEKKLFCEIDK